MGSIEGRNDLWAGRSKEDLISAASQKRNRCFTALSYSADGAVILAGGRLEKSLTDGISVGNDTLRVSYPSQGLDFNRSHSTINFKF